ncbi:MULTISPECIES: hypothetical protein [unclassified Paraburkholderia]|uniref:hypothetical protein n=1 Tax=unclassified Paraburkholderia TaxID=2615204 RepID=UPI000D2FB15C|nr:MULTISPECIES: hypothetical protein [unclassified Paraburkholderia]
MKRQRTPRNWIEITALVNSVDVTGAYSVDNDDVMTVRMNGGGSKIARGGPAAESIARMILGELYREAHR